MEVDQEQDAVAMPNNEITIPPLQDNENNADGDIVNIEEDSSILLKAIPAQ